MLLQILTIMSYAILVKAGFPCDGDVVSCTTCQTAGCTGSWWWCEATGQCYDYAESFSSSCTAWSSDCTGNCAADCPWAWLGDGVCDPSCDVAACLSDLGDCDQSPSPSIPSPTPPPTPCSDCASKPSCTKAIDISTLQFCDSVVFVCGGKCDVSIVAESLDGSKFNLYAFDYATYLLSLVPDTVEDTLSWIPAVSYSICTSTLLTSLVNKIDDLSDTSSGTCVSVSSTLNVCRLALLFTNANPFPFPLPLRFNVSITALPNDADCPVYFLDTCVQGSEYFSGRCGNGSSPLLEFSSPSLVLKFIEIGLDRCQQRPGFYFKIGVNSEEYRAPIPVSTDPLNPYLEGQSIPVPFLNYKAIGVEVEIHDLVLKPTYANVTLRLRLAVDLGITSLDVIGYNFPPITFGDTSGSMDLCTLPQEQLCDDELQSCGYTVPSPPSANSDSSNSGKSDASSPSSSSSSAAGIALGIVGGLLAVGLLAGVGVYLSRKHTSQSVASAAGNSSFSVSQPTCVSAPQTRHRNYISSGVRSPRSPRRVRSPRMR